MIRSTNLRRLACLLAATVLAAAPLGLLAPPAQAQHAGLTDPRGDAQGQGHDVTWVKVWNQRRQVIARVRVAEKVAGEVLVGLEPRRGFGVRMLSRYNRDGTTRKALLPGGFFGRPTVGSQDQAIACPGFKVTWAVDAPVVTMVLPSRCLEHGRYGAIRFAVLTEAGMDSDYAPQTQSGDLRTSRWVPRG